MENTKIEWCNHTVNLWIGCTKVSPACTNCYAESYDARWNKTAIHWGKNSPRQLTKNPIQKLISLNKKAAEAGETHRVFINSLSDFFEDHQEVIERRNEFFEAVQKLNNLILMLLTKRPENILRMIPSGFSGQFPKNVWLGTTVENQEMADERIGKLMAAKRILNASVAFLSIEPLLGNIEFNRTVFVSENFNYKVNYLTGGYGFKNSVTPLRHELTGLPTIDLVIVGGESGHNARPMHPDWVRLIRDQCKEAGVPFFFKQWGEWRPFEQDPQPPFYSDCATGEMRDAHSLNFIDPITSEPGKFKGFKWMDYMDALLFDDEESAFMFLKMGKKHSGRLLDGIEYSEMPGDL